MCKSALIFHNLAVSLSAAYSFEIRYCTTHFRRVFAIKSRYNVLYLYSLYGRQFNILIVGFFQYTLPKVSFCAASVADIPFIIIVVNIVQCNFYILQILSRIAYFSITTVSPILPKVSTLTGTSFRQNLPWKLFKSNLLFRGTTVWIVHLYYRCARIEHFRFLLKSGSSIVCTFNGLHSQNVEFGLFSSLYFLACTKKRSVHILQVVMVLLGFFFCVVQNNRYHLRLFRRPIK